MGGGPHPPEWMQELLSARERSRAAPTFSPDGLYLAGIRYDAGWQLPDFSPMIPFLQ